VPYEGRSKRRTSERAEVTGYFEPAPGAPEQVVVFVRKGQKLRGRWEQRTVEERLVRRRPRPDRRPLDQKLGSVYRRMTLEALGDPDIAA
jgi:hypothetical protein